MEKTIRELKLARGILISEGKVLLVRDIRPGQGHYFLPGGSVEPGEPVRRALIREWDEELGWKVEPGPFLGCLESGWIDDREGKRLDVFEVNFIFRVEVAPETLNLSPVSKEPHLVFSWHPIGDLSGIRLLPEPLKVLIPKVVESESTNAIWMTTLPE